MTALVKLSWVNYKQRYMFQSSVFSFTIFIFHYHLTLLKEVRCDEFFWEENIYPGCSERICRTFRCVMALATFFMKKNAASDIIINRQPFYEFFSVFYHYGLYAVELFFMISGFIFFYLYADNIHSNKTSAKTFIVNRVSRLYPLY
ncbi:acyltransferase family protein, partial [Escherichia coli]